MLEIVRCAAPLSMYGVSLQLDEVGFDENEQAVVRRALALIGKSEREVAYCMSSDCGERLKAVFERCALSPLCLRYGTGEGKFVLSRRITPSHYEYVHFKESEGRIVFYQDSQDDLVGIERIREWMSMPVSNCDHEEIGQELD